MMTIKPKTLSNWDGATIVNYADDIGRRRVSSKVLIDNLWFDMILRLFRKCICVVPQSIVQNYVRVNVACQFAMNIILVQCESVSVEKRNIRIKIICFSHCLSLVPPWCACDLENWLWKATGNGKRVAGVSYYWALDGTCENCRGCVLCICSRKALGGEILVL